MNDVPKYANMRQYMHMSINKKRNGIYMSIICYFAIYRHPI